MNLCEQKEGEQGRLSLLDVLRHLLGLQGVLSAQRDCEVYCTGARYGQGTALAVLLPETHEQVVAILELCAQYQQKLVLQGANTGLVAASTPDASADFVVLSLQRLKKHIAIDVTNRSVEVDAGVNLQELNDALLPHGLFFPIDLAANPSIGGMIASNTGGAKLIRYGDVRHNLLGLRAVFLEPAGKVLDLRTALRKNNTGPDLKQLFVGSSGAYGVITRAVLQLHHLPKQSVTALVVPHDQASILTLLQSLENQCQEFLSAFEGMSGAALRAVLKHIPGTQNPFAPEACPDYCVLIELSSSADPLTSGIDLTELLMRHLEPLLGTVIHNAVIGRNTECWRLRHAISEAIRHEGRVLALDISMPRSALVDFRSEAISLLEQRFPWLQLYDFGHWADGGCHFNLVWPALAEREFDPVIVAQLRRDIYDLVVHQYQGSFSAEHGIGPYNIEYYQRYVSREAKQVAGSIQNIFDPQHLLGRTWFGEAY